MADDSFDPGSHVGESVTVRGTAWTAAAGPMVKVGDRAIYIEDLDAWPDALEGRPVEVTGRLRLRESQIPDPDEDDDDPFPLHGLDAPTFVLDDASWEPVT